MLRIAVIVLFICNFIRPATAEEVVRIGTYGNYPPWTIQAPDGTITGFEIDMIADLCRRMKVHCSVVAVDFTHVFDDVDAGAYDVYIGGMTATAERTKHVDFSVPYAATSSAFMTLSTNSLITSLSPDRFDLDQTTNGLPESLVDFLGEMKGRRLAVHANTVQERFADTYLRDKIEIRRYTDELAMYDDTLAGRVDAVMATGWSLYNFVASHRDRKDPPVLFGPILDGGMLGRGLAAAVRRGNTERLEQINTAISAAAADGTLARLSLRWFGYNIAH